MSQSTSFSAQDSYHKMLLSAQSVSPVLTYVVCKLLTEIPDQKLLEKFSEVESRDVRMGSSDLFNFYFQIQQIHRFVEMIFNNFAVRVSTLHEAREGGHAMCLYAHREFVLYLKSIQLTFNDDNRSVLIPT